MDCFPDFCLGCDSQATDGLYCSESCRMADISRSSGSTPTSPVTNFTTANVFSFIFPKDLNPVPSKYPPPPTKSASSSSLTKIPPYPAHHGHSHSAGASPTRVLSPSTSRSSLNSTGTATTDATAAETAKELMSYFNAFDRTRDERRKSVPATRQAHIWTVPDSH